MWSPRWFRKLAKSMGAQSRAIQEASDKQEETIRHAAEASQSQNREIAGIIASAIETAPKDVPGYEYAQRDKEYRLQHRIFWATIGAAVVAAIYAGIAALQLKDFDESIGVSQITAHESRVQAAASQRATEITRQALTENERQFNETLKQIKSQTAAQQDAADAAKSAANTAKEALHVSERAYVIIQEPIFDFPTKSIKLPLANSGHIPSGKMVATVHEATFNVANFGDLAVFEKADEKYWQHTDWDSIVPGSHQSLEVPLSLLNADKVNGGLQFVIVAGTLSYNDGFTGTPQQTWRFCFRNLYQTTMKQSFITYCDPNEFLPKLEAIDGYPNNEHKE